MQTGWALQAECRNRVGRFAGIHCCCPRLLLVGAQRGGGNLPRRANVVRTAPACAHSALALFYSRAAWSAARRHRGLLCPALPCGPAGRGACSTYARSRTVAHCATCRADGTGELITDGTAAKFMPASGWVGTPSAQPDHAAARLHASALAHPHPHPQDCRTSNGSKFAPGRRPAGQMHALQRVLRHCRFFCGGGLALLLALALTSSWSNARAPAG